VNVSVGPAIEVYVRPRHSLKAQSFTVQSMARTAGSSGEKTNKAITSAALALFAERGYAAVSMRSIAQEVGIQVGALYNHFATKQEVLARIMLDHMQELLDAWDVALKGATTSVDKVETFVRFHVRYHMTQRLKLCANAMNTMFVTSYSKGVTMVIFRSLIRMSAQWR